jgi:sugar phosphate isomerase/epimerase
VGLRTIPLGLPSEPRYVLENDPSLFQATRRALRETGVQLHDIEDAIIDVDRDVQRYQSALVLGAELGAKHVICNVWGGEPSFVQDQFDQLCDLAAPLGMAVQAEFVTFTQMADLQDAWRLVKASGRANAGVLIDMLHFLRSGVAVEEIDDIPPERFAFVHLDDGPAVSAPSIDFMKQAARGARLYVGEGVAPIREVISRLPEVPLAIEIIHSKRVGQLGYEAFAAECLAHARRYIEGV